MKLKRWMVARGLGAGGSGMGSKSMMKLCMQMVRRRSLCLGEQFFCWLTSAQVPCKCCLDYASFPLAAYRMTSYSQRPPLEQWHCNGTLGISLNSNNLLSRDNTYWKKFVPLLTECTWGLVCSICTRPISKYLSRQRINTQSLMDLGSGNIV